MLKLLKQYKIAILAFLVCLMGIGNLVYERGKTQEFQLETKDLSDVAEFEVEEMILSSEEDGTQEASIKLPQMVPIYICGAVKEPGVYYIQEDALINEAINIGGGFTAEANREYLNLASPIQANGKIVVPKQGEEIDKTLDSYDNKESGIVETVDSATLSVESGIKCININVASVQELMGLPGIGQIKAEAIKAYREESGDFKEISELTKVPGIGDKTFEKIQELITAQ